MIHTMNVPEPVWCKWCKTTTECTTVISGDGNPSITLNHNTCGRIIAEMNVRELQEIPSIQRLDIARELVKRANLLRPVGNVTGGTVLSYHEVRNVGQLREALKHLPDETPFVLEVDGKSDETVTFQINSPRNSGDREVLLIVET